MQPLFRLSLVFTVLAGLAAIAQAADVPLDPAMNQIRGIRVLNSSADQPLNVILEAAQPLEYEVHALSTEDTGVADVVYLNIYRCYSLVQGGRSFDQDVEHEVVSRVRLNQYRLDPPMVRLVFDVTELVEPQVEQVGQTDLRVTFPARVASKSVTSSQSASVSQVDVAEAAAGAEDSIPASPPKATPYQGSSDTRETVVLRLSHHPADQMVPVIQSLLSQLGIVVADEWTNSLILRDVPANIQDIRDVVDQLDQPRKKQKGNFRRTKGTFRTVEEGQLHLVLLSGENSSFVLPAIPGKRLKKRYQECQPGDMVRVRWSEAPGQGRVVRSIKKLTKP